MKNFLTYMIFLGLVVAGCDMLRTPVLENPSDPSSQYFQGMAPSDFSVDVISSESIILKWKNNSNYLSKLLLQRSTDEGPFYNIAELGGTDTSFTDSNLSLQHYYSYRISAVSGNGNFSMSNPVKLHYVPYSDSTYTAFGSVSAFCLSPDSRYIAFRKSNNNEILLYDLIHERSVATFASNARAFAFSYNGNFLLTGNNTTDRIELREASTGQVVRVFDGCGSDIISIAASSGDSIVASIDYTETLRIFDFNSGKEKTAVPLNTSMNDEAGIKLSPDGSHLALYTPTNRNLVVKNTRSLTNEIIFSNGWDFRFFFTSDSRYLYFQNFIDKLNYWDLKNGLNEESDMNSSKFIVYSPDERFLVLYSYGNAEVWSAYNLRKTQLLKTYKFSNEIAALAIIPDGRIAVLDTKGGLKIINNRQNWLIY